MIESIKESINFNPSNELHVEFINGVEKNGINNDNIDDYRTYVMLATQSQILNNVDLVSDAVRRNPNISKAVGGASHASGVRAALLEQATLLNIQVDESINTNDLKAKVKEAVKAFATQNELLKVTHTDIESKLSKIKEDAISEVTASKQAEILKVNEKLIELQNIAASALGIAESTNIKVALRDANTIVDPSDLVPAAKEAIKAKGFTLKTNDDGVTIVLDAEGKSVITKDGIVTLDKVLKEIALDKKWIAPVTAAAEASTRQVVDLNRTQPTVRKQFGN